MNSKGIEYESLFAEDDNGEKLAEEYGIVQVPALFVKSDNQEVAVIRDMGEIIKFIETVKI